jgi:hypothetical protein
MQFTLIATAGQALLHLNQQTRILGFDKRTKVLHPVLQKYELGLDRIISERNSFSDRFFLRGFKFDRDQLHIFVFQILNKVLFPFAVFLQLLYREVSIAFNKKYCIHVGFLMYIIKHSYEQPNKCIKANIQLLSVAQFWKRLCSHPIRIFG